MLKEGYFGFLVSIRCMSRKVVRLNLKISNLIAYAGFNPLHVAEGRQTVGKKLQRQQEAAAAFSSSPAHDPVIAPNVR